MDPFMGWEMRMNRYTKLFLVTLFVSAPLFAEAIVPKDFNTVLELNISGGFTATPASQANGVRVLTDGTIQAFDANSETTIGQISRERMDVIFAGLAKTPKDGKLIDANPNAPQCADAPDIQYRITNEHRELVTVIKEVNCHTFRMRNAYGAEYFRQLLDGLRTLGVLSPDFF
jgi:hypothetical protein